MSVSPKAMMWVFGFVAIGGMALFLALYQSSPGPLSSPHAKAMPGNFVWSCKKCHADDGLEAGCLSCHEEIAGQLKSDAGFHAYLGKQSKASCEACHPEHHGADFPLVSEVSWKGTNTNNFSHPQVEFKLAGKHNGLACDKCHNEKLHEPFALDGFPNQVRTDTMLGLDQECITCHQDVHGSGDKTRDCTKCHNQDAFKPAPFFNHDKFFILEGSHAKASCASCHQQDAEAPPGKFGPVKGKKCADCHESPHRLERELQGDCMTCHLGTDDKWWMGRRGIDSAYHDKFGFKLEGAHVKVECAKCHAPELPTYADRFPDPSSAGYNRRNEQCGGCHKDPHAGQFSERYASCTACHTVERFKPSTMGPFEHPKSYPLQGGHQAVACIQCHKVDEVSAVRQYQDTPKACKECHANPHGSQFDVQLAQNDCTVCHAPNFSSFKIKEYRHKNMRAFFLGKGHAQVSCSQCHDRYVDGRGMVLYSTTPADCASCHVDVHRGQFLQNGQTRCEQCHGTIDQWKADRFSHDRDSTFALDKAHAKVACTACHLPAPQRDGQLVVQYKPLTTKCEDCHGFQKK